ncbi:6696_t:CDS:2 [Ambispora gerdemannii]|uniref:6696_t:CDS:1 n=1 Tax=Ambispora gerdemannii TaxID=144530 RepID=A0A9N9GQ98_9GLOM|nr:6696_t:CDS:2 [Ambispora gerdemannii]
MAIYIFIRLAFLAPRFFAVQQPSSGWLALGAVSGVLRDLLSIQYRINTVQTQKTAQRKTGNFLRGGKIGTLFWSCTGKEYFYACIGKFAGHSLLESRAAMQIAARASRRRHLASKQQRCKNSLLPGEKHPTAEARLGIPSGRPGSY